MAPRFTQLKLKKMRIQYEVIGEIGSYQRSFSQRELIIDGKKEMIEGNTFERTFECLTPDNFFDINMLMQDAYDKLHETEGLIFSQVKVRTRFTIVDLEVYPDTRDYEKQYQLQAKIQTKIKEQYEQS